MPRKSSKSTLSKRVNKLERISRPEVKFNQAESGAFDAVGSVSGTLITPQELAEGVGRNQRIGDKVKTRNIRMQAIFKTVDQRSSACRFLVLRSKFTDPSTSDMPTWYGSVDEDKFFVIKDIMFNMSPQSVDGGSGFGSQVKRIDINIPTGLRKLQYDGNTLQSPSNNEYVIYMLAESSALNVAYNWKHYYIDN